MIEKSPVALPGSLRAIEIAPGACFTPVWLVGSCAIGGRMRSGSYWVPPWINPLGCSPQSSRIAR